MQVQDYIIDHQGFDWPKLLSGWSWLLPRKLTVWLMNRFGDLFLVLEDGSVHMLDIGGGTLQKVAANRDEFISLMNDDENANQLLMIPLVDKLVKAGRRLRAGQCYGYKLPPILGGKYTVGNTAILPIAEHLGFHADLHKQTRDLPDGASVSLEIVNNRKKKAHRKK